MFSSVDLQVAILDAYLCGPSIPRMMNVEGKTYYSSVLLGEPYKIKLLIVLFNNLWMVLTLLQVL